jgi:urease accessory protein
VPYAARPAPAPEGWTRAVLVQTIAGPLAGDVALIDVDVGRGAALELVANAATLAYPAATRASHELRVRLAEGARFAWRPSALILAAGCDLSVRVDLELEGGAAALTREFVVLGRAGERPGAYSSRLRCELDGLPLLHESVEIDAAGIAQSSGAVLAGAGAFASLALLGVEAPGPPGPGELDLPGPGRVLRALAPGSADLESAVAGLEALWAAALRAR